MNMEIARIKAMQISFSESNHWKQIKYVNTSHISTGGCQQMNVVWPFLIYINVTFALKGALFKWLWIEISTYIKYNMNRLSLEFFPASHMCGCLWLCTHTIRCYCRSEQKKTAKSGKNTPCRRKLTSSSKKYCYVLIRHSRIFAFQYNVFSARQWNVIIA